MGQPPPPTVVSKRRYDTGPQILPPRPLAPSVDALELSRDTSNPQPSKATKMSPPGFNSIPQKLSTLAQAEPVSSKLLQEHHAQGVSPSIGAGSQPQQQRPSQALQGPRAGFFTNDRLRPTLQPQPATASEQQPQSQPENRAHQTMLEQPRGQNIQELVHIQDRPKSQDHPSPAARFPQLTQIQESSISQSGPGTGRQLNTPIQARISHAAELDIRPRVAIHQQPSSQHPPQHDQRQELQRPDVATTARRLDTYGVSRQTPMQSPVDPRLSRTFSPPQQPSRPSSVPSAPPPVQQAPKRSNIMSILNDEPAEPQARKRVSDGRPAVPTPPPQSPAGQIYQQPPQYSRREPPTTEPQHSLQQYHQRSSHAQVIPPQQPPQPREGPSNWATVAQRTSLERQPNFQQQRTESPRLQPSFGQQASRAPLQSMPRTHAPTPPPFGHSRASSFAGLQSQQPQQQTQSATQATPVLQPSPYAQIHPQQTMHTHHHHSQHQHQHQHQHQPQPQQSAVQTHQPHHHRPSATSLFPHQYMRQQEAIQQQEAAMQRQLEPARADLLQYQNNIRLEQGRREEVARRTFTPPVFGRHGGYGPPQDGHPRGYEDRR